MAEQRLTDADVKAIVAAIAAQPHFCRFHVDQAEFERSWPVMVGMARSVEQAKTITTRMVITGMMLFVLGALGRGLWVWVTDFHDRIPR